MGSRGSRDERREGERLGLELGVSRSGGGEVDARKGCRARGGRPPANSGKRGTHREPRENPEEETAPGKLRTERGRSHARPAGSSRRKESGAGIRGRRSTRDIRRIGEVSGEGREMVVRDRATGSRAPELAQGWKESAEPPKVGRFR
ncbi:hypothetical protein WJX74_007239 [Apatococcus lobatus]|uniref:Uncharacterized protein n=1 Tax=Apatococcus lobatus TaxID=904363 RepID=A0AAW1R1Q2_9CHLO